MRVVFVSQSGVLILPGTSEKCLVPHEWYKVLAMITQADREAYVDFILEPTVTVKSTETLQ